MLLPQKACLLRSRFQFRHVSKSLDNEKLLHSAVYLKSSEGPQEVQDISPRLLLSEINAIPAVRLFPSQKKLISKFKSFLVHNFCSEPVETTHTNYKELNEILAKVYLKNTSLAAYVDACLQTAEVNQALKSLNSRRQESRSVENLTKGTLVEDDIIFELLCRHFALKASKENFYADVFADAKTMENAFQAQLKLEMAGTVSVAPVLPFFEDMCKTPKSAISATASKSGSALNARTVHKNLVLEQNLWSKQLMRAFEATLQRLKSAHAHGQITAYPFLKIMPRRAYVDLLIRTVNSIITDSELQHISRSLLLVRLGERVEAACVVWRKQNLGIIDELKLTYGVYASLFTSPERKASSLREAWLRALQVRSEDGICLNPQWPQWNSHIRLIVGQELYRILYDHLTFNLNGARLPEPSSDKEALPPRQEAPVLFEVSSENPAESRYEIKVHPTLLKWYRLVGHMPLQFEVTELPMLCPPIPWIDTDRAGYLLASSDATRLIRRPNYFYGTDAAANDDLDFDASKILLVLDALNALASCPWKVNNSAAEQRDKEAFNSQLQALVERLPRRDLLIVAGDWNGRTGPGDPTTSHVLGRFGLGSRCENGERLLNFADRNRLPVTNTCFQHRKKHLLTWYSNDGHTASQSDYILVSSRFRSWVHDSRSMCGAETGNAHWSDHVLVRIRLKVHLSSAPKIPRPRRLDVVKIRHASTAEALSREIRPCFTTRADGEVSNQWSSLKTSVYGAAEKILGYTQRRRSDWISGRTLQLSAQTARARSRNDGYFRQLRKMTAKSARDDRKQYWAEIATSMEQASNAGDTRKLYRLIRQVSGKPSTLSDSVRDVNGGFVADNSAKVERWREHFEHHLNFDTQSTSPLLSSSAEFLSSPTCAVPCDPPSEGEVADATRKLRNNKALGEDGIPAEVFKSCVDTLAPWLHEVIERAWRDEVVPDDWGLGILVLILKKGDKTGCENYRGISLIDVALKIFAIVLLRRFRAVRDSRTRLNQAGFRAGRGCADQIFTLRRILEFRHSYQRPTAVCFIDFAAAFDSVHRFGDLQSMVSRVNEIANSVGLSINAAKTKLFSSCIPDQEKAPLGIDGCQLEEVDSFKYLEARLLPNGQSKDDIVSRIDAARRVFSSLRKCLWIRRDLSIATKIRVYRTSVWSVLLYGCECWALRVEDERKLDVFDHYCLRTILRVKFTDLVSNETVRARCDNISRITPAIQERRLRWFGHVLRRPPQELRVTALDPAPLPHWRRRRGGPFKTWLDTVRQDMEVVLGPSVFGLRRWRREWVELSRSAAADRHAWRGTVRDIIEAG
nr:unnamed protein product [Spirometra erinaceieuropaei]